MGYRGCMVRWILTQPMADNLNFLGLHDYIFSRKKFKGLFHGPLAEKVSLIQISKTFCVDCP